MCVGIPGQILEIVDVTHRIGIVEVSGQRREVNLGLLPPDECAVGEWVLVHAGLAVSHMEPDEAQSTLEFLRELDQLYEEAHNETIN